MTGRADLRRGRVREARARVAHRMRAAFALTSWCAAAAVLAAAAVTWTLAGAAAVSYTALSTVELGQVAASAAAYLMIAVLAVAVPLGVTAARVVRYHRTERAADRRRWEDAEPLLAAILAETRAENAARAARPAKPALPRPAGMAVES